MEYDDLLADVRAGHLVALAPAYNTRGEPVLVRVTGELPPLDPGRIKSLTCEQRVRMALAAVRQVREHYGI